jgi:CheY-like chemotaxis protein
MNRKRILLAEDDEDDRAFFSNFMKERSDVTLHCVLENGEEVLEFLLSGRGNQDAPDLILLDQNMPRLNGIQTLRKLKNNTYYKDVPVFIYTTYPDDDLKQLCEEAGAVNIFTKPYSIEGYHQMLEEMLSLIK